MKIEFTFPDKCKGCQFIQPVCRVGVLEAENEVCEVIMDCECENQGLCDKLESRLHKLGKAALAEQGGFDK